MKGKHNLTMRDEAVKALVRILEWLVILLMIVLTLTVLWGVYTRFCTPRQASYTDELACTLLIWISMFGGALAFGAKAHLGVDYFVGKLTFEARKIVAVAVQVCVAAFAVIVFLMGGWVLALAQMGQQLTTMPWLTKGGVYLAIPAAGGFILLFAVENVLAIIRSRPPTQQQNEEVTHD